MTTGVAARAPVSRAVTGERRLAREVVVFGLVGAASTLLHLGGFALLRQVGPAQVANAVALLVAAVANTWANGRWTFRVRGADGALLQQVQGLVVFALTLATTSGGLTVLHALVPSAPTWVETAVVAGTTVTATVVKFLAMRWWVFAPTSARPWRSGRDLG